MLGQHLSLLSFSCYSIGKHRFHPDSIKNKTFRTLQMTKICLSFLFLSAERMWAFSWWTAYEFSKSRFTTHVRTTWNIDFSSISYDVSYVSQLLTHPFWSDPDFTWPVIVLLIGSKFNGSDWSLSLGLTDSSPCVLNRSIVSIINIRPVQAAHNHLVLYLIPGQTNIMMFYKNRRAFWLAVTQTAQCFVY